MYTCSVMPMLCKIMLGYVKQERPLPTVMIRNGLMEKEKYRLDWEGWQKLNERKTMKRTF